MSWHRVDDGFPEHPKLEALEHDARLWADALALWLAAACYCRRAKTGGFVSTSRLVRLTPMGPRRTQRVARALAREAKIVSDGSGLWIEEGGGYRFHDWDEYGPEHGGTPAPTPAAERARRYRKNRKAQRAVRDDDPSRDARHVTSRDDRDMTSRDDRDMTYTRARDPGPARKEEEGKEKSKSPRTAARARGGFGSPGGDPQTPPPPPRPAKRDPMALARDRLDVQRVFERWKQTFGYDRATLGPGSRSPDADILADAIDEHGEQACLDVLDVAPEDGMVSGKQDEQGKPHESIRYIFGNADTLRRLLRAADEARGRTSRRKSAAELYEEYTRR